MKNKGFTLIELLVVIAIIALLASIIITNLSTTRNKAEVAKTQVQAREIKKAIELSWLNSESYPVQQEGLTMKEVVEDAGASTLKTAIEEYYKGPVPSIPDSEELMNNDFWYISNGGKAIDSNGYEYICGYNGKTTADDFVLFSQISSLEAARDWSTRGILMEDWPYDGITNMYDEFGNFICNYDFNLPMFDNILFTIEDGDETGYPVFWDGSSDDYECDIGGKTYTTHISEHPVVGYGCIK